MDKVVLITGAGNGNGFEISNHLIESGYKVCLVDKDISKIKKKYIKLNTSSILLLKLDLSISNNYEKVVKKCLSKFKKLDILINNAGITLPKNILKYSRKDFQKTININLEIPFLLIQSTIKYLAKSKNYGRIINITSLSSHTGFSNNPAYAASKGGLRYLSKSLANDLSKYKILINNICPGYIRTSMTAKSYNDKNKFKYRNDRTLLKRWGESKDLLSAVDFLLDDRSTYITGSDIVVDGGWLSKGL
jgi:NAD(P)-dependent dehydrogenase (short-subunit alcohol dehydrogenase family)